MAGDTTYLFYDLVTNTLISELPLQSVTFSKRLNTPGPFSATLDLSDPRVQAMSPLEATLPARTAVYIDVDGVLEWGGILWTRRWLRSSRKLQIAGNQFWSYFQQREQAADYSTTWALGGDPLSIAETVVNDAQEVPGGNIGVIVPTNNTGGHVTIVETYPITQLQSVNQIVSTMSQMGYTVGFDFAIDVAYDDTGTPAKFLTLSWPRRGRIASETQTVIDVTNDPDFEYDEDGTKCSNKLYETGSGTGAVQATAESSYALSIGYPLLEQVVSRTAISNPATLQAAANGDLSLFTYPALAPVATVPAFGTNWALGDSIEGDDVLVVCDPDERFPSGLSTELRIVGIDTTIADQGLSTVKLTFNVPPSTTPETPPLS